MNTPYAQSTSNPAVKKSSAGKVIAIILAVLLGITVVCGGLILALALPAIQAARGAARQMSCANNLKQIALAMHNYESAYKTLPAAYRADENGKKLHSWRTSLLPFLGHVEAYNGVDWSKPWNAPENAFLMDLDIPAFNCPSGSLAPGQTTYVVVADPSGMFPNDQQVHFSEISDGASNTIAFVEVPANMAVHWACPDDISLQEFMDLTGEIHISGMNIAMADGSVRQMELNTDAESRKAMVTRDGNDSAFLLD